MAEQYPVPVPPEPVDDAERLAAVTRLHDLVGSGSLSLERFSASLERVLAANDQADLEMAMSALPSPVRLTPGGSAGRRDPPEMAVRSTKRVAVMGKQGHRRQVNAEFGHF